MGCLSFLNLECLDGVGGLIRVVLVMDGWIYDALITHALTRSLNAERELRSGRIIWAVRCCRGVQAT